MSKYRYVYVDDDPMSREVMKILLTEVIGVQSLDIFEDSEHFLSRVLELQAIPDFIFVDIHMEPNDGYELLRVLRSEPRLQDCKVIAVTAAVMAEEVRHLQRSGFDGALSKPLDMVVFPSLIERLEAGETIWQVN